MKKIFNWMLAAIFICGLTIFTACTSDNDDNPTPGGTTAELVGRWTADVTGATATLWGDGKAMQMTELNSDGTGSTDTYYLLNEDIAAGRSHQTFRYTATADAEFAAIAADIDAAFSDAFVRREDVNWNTEQRLPHYTLSVCLVDHDTYVRDFTDVFDVLCNFNEGYEQTTFHQLTGWGQWLNANQQLPKGNPTSGGSGEGFGDDDDIS